MQQYEAFQPTCNWSHGSCSEREKDREVPAENFPILAKKNINLLLQEAQETLSTKAKKTIPRHYHTQTNKGQR